MPKRTDHQVDPGDRRRPDRDRAGLRVRLLRHPGGQGAQGRGLPGDPGQLQPGHDHDRSGPGGCDLRRAGRARDRRQGDRARAPGRLPADHGRSDRAQRGAGARRGRHVRALWRGADRRLARGDRQGRGSPAVPRGDAAGSASRCRAAWSCAAWPRPRRPWTRSACRRSSGRATRSAAPAAALPTTARSSSRWSPPASTPRRSARC